MIVEPRLGVHLVQPALRDPPLGVDLVVVEDHRHRHRREQPADRRLRPRLAVGQRVLAEVGQLVGRDVGRALTPREDLLQRRRGLVGIDLVAEHQQHVRAGAAAAGARDTQRVGAQRVDALAGLVLARAQHVRRLVRPRDPARAEHDVTAPARVQQADRAGGKRRSRLRPHELAVQAHLVRVILAHGKPLDRDQREVQPLDAPRALTDAQDLDLAGGVGLHPDRRHPVVDVPHDRSEDEAGHAATLDHRPRPSRDGDSGDRRDRKCRVCRGLSRKSRGDPHAHFAATDLPREVLGGA